MATVSMRDHGQGVRAGAVRARADAVPTIRRTAETWLAVVGMVASAVFLGGFALVMNRTDEQAFLDTLYPAMTDAGVAVASADAYDAARTLAAWFGLTLVVVLLVSAAGIYVARRRPVRRSTGWWFLGAGLVCLFGSQLVLYPIAFLFFVAAGLFALRRPDPTVGQTPDPTSETGSTS
ncbi:hypothetical protein [Krasilnikoviella flava]|uniref:DUF4064 domain-containing protein n=1 Tax=Krasilnikoviella flava TaxID=526729 RepID=A0A1T5IHF1_9MICO|nr:hypothetical protein [Krasilnikoviella flava]SKC38587.1 hypothetical protein SAMN04324258_0526 [Krasilnikoviella flava]